MSQKNMENAIMFGKTYINKKTQLENKRLCLEGFYELSEKDFYPPKDTRVYKSNVYDIPGGDSFDDYIKWFNKLYEVELYDT